MTRLVVEPDALPLLFPKASVEEPVKLRLVVQVHDHDPRTAILLVRKLPNLPQLVVHIDLDGNSLLRPPFVEVDLAHIVEILPNMTISGLAVNIIGMYDGKRITAFECTHIDAQLLLGGRIELLAQMATLRNL